MIPATQEHAAEIGHIEMGAVSGTPSTADRREQVDAFHAAALKSGGRDNGAPRLRPEYSDGYYSAFVLDPDGHNVEAVAHGASPP